MEVAPEPRPHEVHVAPLSPERFRGLLDPPQWDELDRGLAEARRLFAGRVLWNVNSTATGGGVAEMLRSFLAYARGAGLDMRWAVITGNPAFFAVTKRIHNFLHGAAGDGGGLGEAEKRTYEDVAEENGRSLRAVLRPGDVVLLHDPQTAGLAAALEKTGATVIWRSHVGAEVPNERVKVAWNFLAPYLDAADACVFSRHAYVPPWVEGAETEVIQPSIDAFSPKNQEIGPEAVDSILAQIGLLDSDVPGGVVPTFTRYDGSPGRVDRRCEVVTDGLPRIGDPLVVQVSRWDRLKDPDGVMHGFAEHVAGASGAHLVLAGPAVAGVADDPEGAEVLGEVAVARASLKPAARRRIHLACLPMADIDENAAMVNALQRHAHVVVQKSLQEGFGLTVSEAMWKARPVVASAVGGIRDQVEDGVTGLLVGDPTDLAEFGRLTLDLLGDPERAAAIGARAREHVRRRFLADRHALQYIRLFTRVLR
jgi:trehalose synthase